jgi:hypothetical protein
MPVGCKRILIGRIGVVLGFVCGVIGLVAGLTDHVWKLWPSGWFEGGALLVLIGLFALVDAAIAQHQPRS